MVVDFNVIQYGERPTLILKNLDGTPIQLIVNAYDISCKLSYNEVSELSFVIPSIIDGEKFPGYDKIVGMRIIEWKGIGNFILINPSIVKNDSGESKQCKAYSLEYELTYKKIFFEEGTYNFWNPVAPNNTILGMIREVAPDWKIGEVDEELIGRYRITGCIVNIWLQLDIWDYSDLWGNILGQVCPLFTLIWAPLILLAIVLDDVIRWKFFGEEKPIYHIL